MTPESKPQGSEQPEDRYLVIACGEGHETHIAAWSDLIPTIENLYYDEHEMDDEVRASWERALNDDSEWEHDNRGRKTQFSHEFECERVRIVLMTGKGPWEMIEELKGKLLALPNPSADEEVETPLVDAAFAEYPVMDTQRGGDAITIQAARAIEKQLRQQHNAEREALHTQIREIQARAVIDGTCADDMQRAFHAEAEVTKQLRASLAEKEATLAGSDQLLAQCRELLELENGQSLTDRLAALQSELATAQRERDAISDLLDQMIKYAENLGASLRAVRSEPVTGQPGVPY